jgi:hypothetical protein
LVALYRMNSGAVPARLYWMSGRKASAAAGVYPIPTVPVSVE